MAEGPPPPETAALAMAVYKKVATRLMPFLGLCYVVAYMDRVNVGFAKLQMATQLHLSDTAYGLGAGIFFLGYFLFEVPSNLILHRVGAKIWLARIMITWGLISGAMAALGPLSASLGPSGSEYAFYGLRFLLGLAEAGFFPGVLLYLTYWFPASRQSFALALFILAQPIAFVLGAPLSGLIMERFQGVGGLAGWQWMYLLEAAPAVALGVWLPFRLDNRIADAKWLTAAERTLLQEGLEREAPAKRTVDLSTLAANKLIWLFAGAYFLLVIGAYGLNFWLPSIIKAAGVQGYLSIGLLTALPYAVSVLVMLSISVRTPEPETARRRAAAMAIVGGFGLLFSAMFSGVVPAMMVGITIGVTGYLSATALFWCVPGKQLAGPAAAAGLAAINAIGNLGGFVGPYVVGALTERFGRS
ncbi:MAG: MFS transporter, partial [Caulobacteraceae bacterium]